MFIEVIMKAHPTIGGLHPKTRPGLIEYRLQALLTKSKNSSCKCSRYNSSSGNIVHERKKTKAKKYSFALYVSFCANE